MLWFLHGVIESLSKSAKITILLKYVSYFIPEDRLESESQSIYVFIKKSILNRTYFLSVTVLTFSIIWTYNINTVTDTRNNYFAQPMKFTELL